MSGVLDKFDNGFNKKIRTINFNCFICLTTKFVCNIANS